MVQHKDMHWCPNGCGKKVVYTFEVRAKKHFKCLRCNSLFTKKQIEVY